MSVDTADSHPPTHTQDTDLVNPLKLACHGPGMWLGNNTELDAHHGIIDKHKSGRDGKDYLRTLSKHKPLSSKKFFKNLQAK